MELTYPDNLPITGLKDAIKASLKSHQVVIVAGDTGSGKTTQLPKMCLETFGDSDLLIGCTQPRRIAATSVSQRVGDELGSRSDLVGYKIRFHDHTTTSTRIKFMTDGVLLAETRRDKLLSKYKVIIVDEAHERSLNIDFLLGYLKQLLPRRPDLKVIVTSATIDTSAFSQHFDDAPIVTIPGRSFPVSVEYHPLETEDSEDSSTVIEHCLQVVTQIMKKRPSGNILIFLATERDIRECTKLLLDRKFQRTSVLPLFGRLPSHEQRRIFQKGGNLKIIVSTNVAETSLTVPGIEYVVDSGLARISQYNTRAKTTSLPVTRVSRASCDQRKGRCGRVGPGICMRLYSEEDYFDRSEFTIPELKRSNLAEVILQMVSLGLGKPDDFPFIEPPFKSAIREGYSLLKELGALDQSLRLTANGKFMAALPIDPCISRIILEAKQLGCLREIKIIAALLAIQDPKVRPADKEQAAKEAHKQFHHKQSDFLTYLNIWDQYHQEAGHKKSWSNLKKFCNRHYLSFQRMREWFDLHDQLDRLLGQRDGFSDNNTDADYEQIHKALLPGFIRNLAKKKRGRIYTGTHNKELMIFPGSGQFDVKPDWILAASFIETSNLYALNVASISPQWIETAAQHLCKYSWVEPHWQKKTGQVIAKETVTLFGLPLSSGRKVNFGKRSKKNISEARNIFVSSALVKGELSGSYSFLANNLAKISKWEESEDKLRVKNITVDDLTYASFYHERLPNNVYDQRTLNKLLKRKRSHSFLFMKDEDILLRNIDQNELVDFPVHKSIGSIDLRLEYHFSPGDDTDGVTFRIPVDLAPNLSPDPFEWLVPGLLKEKITFLLKGLPKSVRKKLVPISGTVDQILDDLTPGNISFLPSLEQSILKQFRLQVKRSDWKTDLPLHLMPRFLLFDEKGKECGTGRDLGSLVHTLGDMHTDGPSKKKTFNADEKKIIDTWALSEHKSWNFKTLPNKIISYTDTGEIATLLYTTLQADKNKGCVFVQFVKDASIAQEQTIKGNLFLLALQFKDQYKALRKLCSTQLSGPSTLLFSKIGVKRNQLIEQTLNYVLLSILHPLPSILMTEDQFNKKEQILREKGLFDSGRNYLEQMLSALRKRREVEDLIKTYFSKAQNKGHYLPPFKDMFLDEITQILPVNFIFSEKPLLFADIELHLQGLAIRMERFYANPGKDKQKTKQLEPHQNRLKELQQRVDRLSPDALVELDLFEAMVNDYKLALFAPETRGRRAVSQKKLEKQWQVALMKC